MQELKIHNDYQLVDVDSITLDPENAKEHDSKDLEEKKASLKMFGFVKPVVVNRINNFIIAGNGIFLAAKALGYKQIPALFVDFSAIRGKSFGIADNRLSDNSKYNLEQFNLNIKDIDEWDAEIDWKALAFDPAEINLLLASMNTQITDSGVPQEGGQDVSQDFDEDSAPARAIKLTKAQREIIDLAVKTLRENEQSPKLSEGQCMELICSNYLAGV